MLPPSLPLGKYEGVYKHPAYQQIALAMVNRTLHADVLERTFSHDHFLVRVSPEGRVKLGKSRQMFHYTLTGTTLY